MKYVARVNLLDAWRHVIVLVVATAVVLRGGQSYHAGSIEGGHGTPSSAAEVMVVASTRYQDRRDPCVPIWWD